MPEATIARYLISVEQQLDANLEIIRALVNSNRLEFDLGGDNVLFVRHDMVDDIRITRVAIQPVLGTIADTEVVLYVFKGRAGFGLYDEKHELCYPVTTRSLVRTWVDDPEKKHRKMLNDLVGDVEHLIAQSAP